MRIFLITVSLLFSFNLAAVEITSLSEIANKRLYRGGLDESDLKVQVDLKPPYKTVNLRAIQKKVYDQILKEASEVGAEGSEGSSN